jgi:hypothetical protein
MLVLKYRALFASGHGRKCMRVAARGAFSTPRQGGTGGTARSELASANNFLAWVSKSKSEISYITRRVPWPFAGPAAG